MPVYNNDGLARQALLEVFRTSAEAESIELIVVDDGSRDRLVGLEYLLRQLEDNFGTRCVYVCECVLVCVYVCVCACLQMDCGVRWIQGQAGGPGVPAAAAASAIKCLGRGIWVSFVCACVCVCVCVCVFARADFGRCEI